jgi:hypothetical protein
MTSRASSERVRPSEQVLTGHATGPVASARQRYVLTGALVLAAMAAVFSETVEPTISGKMLWFVNAPVTLVGVLLTSILLRTSGGFMVIPWSNPRITLGLAFIGCITAGFLGGVGWPNSGDENSMMFLADLMLHGRLFVPPPPDPELFKTFHILTRDGRLFSPYSPGWPAVLALFNAADAAWLAAPAFTLAGGLALWRGLRLVCPPTSVNPLLVLALLNPFTLFLGGSFFAQSMVFALVATIIWLQLADDTAPHWWRKLAIGGLFGLIQLTRYEVLAIVGLCYAVDRLIIRRQRAIQDGLLVAAGLIPFALLLLAYNAAITGNPLQLPAMWADSPEDHLATFDSIETFLSVLLRNVLWSDELFVYGGMPLAGLALAALWAKVRGRNVRFFDLLGPCTIVLYSVQPFTGGHQYGPRYWFLAFPFLSLTVGAASAAFAVPNRDSLSRVSAAALIFSAVAFLGLSVTDGRYMAARRAFYDLLPPQRPAIVLLPARHLVLWPWQRLGLESWAADFTRNGVSFDRPVLYGLLDVPDAPARACRSGRAVYQWQEPGTLSRLSCP